ncbi:MAG TPA: hypothetical protein VFU89_05860 [Rhabdochlamydiaceae bacterium]|nr:hypothetical protein [Rhabdochlamydiaceae bacterium]
MSSLTVQQVVISLRDVLPQVNGQTRHDTVITDRQNLNKTYRGWIAVADEIRKKAPKTTPELLKLDQYQLALQYRTKQVVKETPYELKPLSELFKKLMARLFPGGISEEFVEAQLRYLCRTYPAYAQKLLETTHESLAIEFFRFCLQAPSQSSHRGAAFPRWVDLFVQYPEIAERLMKSSLNEKLGRFPEIVLIDKNKGVCFKMDLFENGVVWVHLKHDSMCQFRNKALDKHTKGIAITGEQIFQQFENSDLPDITISSKGIINFTPLLMQTRDSDGKVHPVDPIKWSDYIPSVELKPKKMAKLFPDNQSQTPFVFVLRVNSYCDRLEAVSSSQIFFDFIIKLSNGNYRVISLQNHQKPRDPLYRQKSFFYPLTEEQGKMVIDKVAKEISHFRQMHVEGKPIPPIDVQSYLDDVLGHDFYAFLEQLLSKHTYPEDIKKGLNGLLAQTRQNLDPGAFEQFLQPVVKKLVDTHDISLIHQLITTSLKTIYTLLGKDTTKIELPTLEEVTDAGKALPNNTLDPMGSSLIALATICFEVLHPYKMSVADAEKETPILGFIFRRIESISWIWLQNLLYSFFLMILGPSRGYHYKKVAISSPKALPRLIQSIHNLVPEKYINRPSQLFDSLSETKKQAVENRLKQHLTVLVAK